MISPIQAESPKSDESTGIEGVITISPARPGPSRIGESNTMPLSNLEFAVQNENGTIASFTTDANGAFRVTVPAGHYTVLRKTRGKIGRFGPFQVDVVAGKMTKVEWTCDSGMR